MTKSRHNDLIDNHIFRSAEVGCGILLYPVLSHNHGHRQSKCQVSKSSSSANDRNDHQMTKEAILPQTDRDWHLEKVRTFGGLEASTTRRLSYSLLAGAQSRTSKAIKRAAAQTTLSKDTLCTRLLLSTFQDSAYRTIFCLDIRI